MVQYTTPQRPCIVRLNDGSKQEEQTPENMALKLTGTHKTGQGDGPHTHTNRMSCDGVLDHKNKFRGAQNNRTVRLSHPTTMRRRLLCVSSISEQTLRHTCDNGGGLILFPCVGYIVGQWVIGIRSTEESLDGKEDCPNLEGWTPFVCNHQKKSAFNSFAKQGTN